jgi:hypothetical protein
MSCFAHSSRGPRGVVDTQTLKGMSDAPARDSSGSGANHAVCWGRLPMKYQSGEEICKGNRVLFHGDRGEIEFVIETLVGDSALDWYVKEYGRGVMVAEPKAGRTFISDTEHDEDLQFVSSG